MRYSAAALLLAALGALPALTAAAASQAAAPPRPLPKELKALDEALRSRDPKVREAARTDLLNRTFRKYPAEDMVPLLLPHLSPPATDLDDVRFQGLLMEHLAREYGPKARAALPTLLATVVNDKVMTYLRGQAIAAAARIGPDDPDVVAALIKAIHNPKPATSSGVHDRAAEALGQMGKAAWRARPALRFLLGHHFDIVQDRAFTALGQLARDEPAKPATEYVRRLGQVGKLPPDEVSAALLALRATAPADRPRVAALARPALLRVIEERPNDYYSRAALDTLAILGPGSSPRAVKAILRCLLRDGTGLAGAALEKFEATDREAVAPLTEALERVVPPSNNWHTRVVLARALARFGKDAAPAVPALVKALRNVRTLIARNDAYSQELAVYTDALAKIAPRRADAVAAVLDLFEPGSDLLKNSGRLAPQARTLLLRGLAGLGLPEDAGLRARAWARIREGLDADRLTGFVAAAQAVAGAGPVTAEEAKPLVPRLLRALRPGFQLKQEEDGWRAPVAAPVAAVRALAHLGPAAREALPVLRALAERPLAPRGGFAPEPAENVVTREAQRAVRAIQ